MEICKKYTNRIIDVCMSFFILLFPLIYRDYYADILQFKYQFYYLTVIIMSLLLAALLTIIRVKGSVNFKQYYFIKKTVNTFRLQDGALLLFWLISLVSTLLSDYRYESFWGNEGRYSGLFLLTLFVATYFIISRLWIWNRWWIELFLLSGTLMCLIGIANYFSYDLLGFIEGMDGARRTHFVSTIGNINTYTAYISLLLGVSTALFIHEKNWKQEVCYYIHMTVAFFAIIFANSDSGYLALGGILLLMPYTIFKEKGKIIKYLVVIATLLTIFPCIGYLNARFYYRALGIDSLFNIISTHFPIFLVVILWLIVTWMGLSYRKKPYWDKLFSQRLIWIWSAILVSGAVIVLIIMIDINVFGNQQRYSSLNTYLLFNDSWGTNRGYIWRKSIELYQDFTPVNKIFGFGPDTVGILATTEIKAETLETLHQIFDNVHNEYLQYFITIGPIGLLAYLVFLISMIYLMLTKKNMPVNMKGCAWGVICYACQAFVNLSVPIVSPMFWLLLSIGMALARME